MASIPFIDLAAQQQRIRPALDDAIARVLDHGNYILGPEVGELESALARFTGSRFCLTCSNGTDALSLGLMAWGIGPGCAVFTTPFTFVATAEVIRLVGATPVFVDIDPVTFNMDATSLETAVQAVTSEGKHCPSAVIPVDLFGQPCDYEAILPVAQKYGLKVLQDSAQGFGGLDNGRRCPVQGDIGATSFFPAKPLGCYGDGGAVFTDNETYFAVMDSIRIHGKGADKYQTARVGLNARMDTMQAAILLEKLKLYPEEIELRQKVAASYAQALAGIDELVLPTVAENCTSVWAQYTVRHPKRERLMATLKAAGIPTAVYYPVPIHLSEAYRNVSLMPVSLQHSEQASGEVFSLPFHPYLTDEVVEQVASVLLDTV